MNGNCKIVVSMHRSTSTPRKVEVDKMPNVYQIGESWRQNNYRNGVKADAHE